MIQKKIANFLFSTRLMAVLYVVFALSMAIATFVENSYTTATAKAWIYNSWWFELILVLFVINFVGNIQRYRLWRREKWPVLIFHLSFILIILGAGVTRYISYEGIMPIREGEVANTMMSEKTYLTTYIDGEINGQPTRRAQEHPLGLAPLLDNHKTIKTDFDGNPITFEVIEYINGAKEGLVADENGKDYLKLVEASGGDRHEHFLEEGKVSSIHNVLFALNEPTDGAINILVDEEGNYQLKTPFSGDYMRMADQHKGSVSKDSIQPLMLRSLYNMAGMQFVFPDPIIKGKYALVEAPENKKTGPDGVRLQVKAGGEQKEVQLLGAKGMIEDFKQINLGGYEIYVRYGSKEFKLPFALKLNDFIAEKHPGTEYNPTPSYASFKSKVELIDEGKSVPKEIYMNHVLDHKGYRFFQASFHPDEKGTVLSVNHDWWGTWITYIGYSLLYIGMIWMFFGKGTRFGTLRKQLKKLSDKKTSLGILLALIGLSVNAQEEATSGKINTQQHTEEHHPHTPIDKKVFKKTYVDSVIKANAITQAHADKFGELVIQDVGGRMKPANTYSSQLLRKLSKSNSYEGLDGDQVLFSMLENPMLWYNVPIIHLEAKNDSIHHVLGIKEGEEHVALTHFFNERGEYKLAPFLEEAYRAEVPDKFQKDYKRADQLVNLLYNTLEGKIFKIFPVPHNEHNKWISYPEIPEFKDAFKGQDSLYIYKALPLYMQSVRIAKSTGNYQQAEDLLQSIKGFQKKYGADILPSDQKIQAEILYNKYDIFKNLYRYYLLFGAVMLIFVVIRIFKNNKAIRLGISTFKWLIGISFVLHTLGLIARWYISGHAPWSDAYESMIYVAWATVLFGIIFGKKSNLTYSSTAFVAAIILFFAHQNWLDPAIANLVPVLDSYWLMIHVSIIVASYGPFTLSFILGILALLLMIFTTAKNKKKLEVNIKEITVITEMAITVGLVMLTIGNFLGGQWANESWGRYWSWDPKETWALISIMVYAFVLHMRLVPGLRGLFAFNWATVFALSSIMMTYFGVNFYLTGLHSYASGDQIISYQFIVIALVLWIILGALAYMKYKKYYKK